MGHSFERALHDDACYVIQVSVSRKNIDENARAAGMLKPNPLLEKAKASTEAGER